MDEATLVAKSHAWLDTYDRFDIPGFTEPLGPTFILYEEARFVDKDSLAKNLQHKNDDHSPPRTRTWSDDYGVAKWDLVTMIYEGTNPARIEKVKPALKKGGLFVLEYFHVDSDIAKTGAGGAKDGELAAEFKDGFKILRDESVEDVADWSLRKTKLVRFVAQKL